VEIFCLSKIQEYKNILERTYKGLCDSELCDSAFRLYIDISRYSIYSCIGSLKYIDKGHTGINLTKQSQSELNFQNVSVLFKLMSQILRECITYQKYTDE